MARGVVTGIARRDVENNRVTGSGILNQLPQGTGQVIISVNDNQRGREDIIGTEKERHCAKREQEYARSHGKPKKPLRFSRKESRRQACVAGSPKTQLLNRALPAARKLPRWLLP